MARIVSGSQEYQDPGFAFLSGYQGARKQRADEQEMQQAQAARQMQLMMALQDAQVQHAYQQARTQQILNEQAGSGDMQALQELSLRQEMHPDDQLFEQAMGILKNVPEKYRKEAAGHVHDIIRTQKQEERYQSVDQEIQRAAEDQVIPPEAVQTYQQRLQAKRQAQESPDDILTEFTHARMTRASEAAHTEENAAALEQAKTLLQSAKPGRNRKLAEIALKEFEMSPSRQKEQGAGEKMLANVQRSLVGSQSEYDKANEKRLFTKDLTSMGGSEVDQDLRMQELGDAFENYPAYAAKKGAQKQSRFAKLPARGETGEEEQAETPEHEASESPEEEQAEHETNGAPAARGRGIQKAAEALLGQSKDLQSFKKALREQGIDLNDPAQLEEVKRAMEARRTNARSNAGADR